MARAIPTYQRQNFATGIQSAASAPAASSAVSASDPVANALGNLGQSASNAGNVMADEAIRLAMDQKKKIENQAAVDVSNVLSKGEVYWQENSTRRMQDWKVGDPDMRAGLGSEFDAWVAESEATLPTDAAKKYFRQHTNTMKVRLQTNAFSYQERSTTAKLNADSEVGAQADENVVYSDPGRFDEIYKRRVEPLLARTDLSEAEKIKTADIYKRKLSLAVERGEMQRDPVGWYTKRFGEFKPGVGGTGTPAAASAPAGVTRNTDGTVTLDTDRSLPAGMRNNNPGNIIWANQKNALGPSVNRDNNGANAQAVYATPEEGMAAMFTLALKKYGGGKTTAESLIASQGGWTPGNSAAAANVAKAMGLSPNDDLNLRDPAMLQKFARALMLQEHGQASKKYSDEMVARVAGDVLAGRKTVPAGGPTPVVATGAPAAGAPAAGGAAPVASAPVQQPATFKGMDWEQQDALRQMAETRIKQSEAVYKAQVDTVLRDAVAMHKDGIQDPKPIPIETFNRAYGAEAPRMYEEYQKSRQMGADIGQFKTQSEAEIMATLERTKPQPGPGYASEDARQATRVQAAQSVIQARDKDPAGYATNNSEALKGQQAALSVPTLSAEERAVLTQNFVRNNLAEQTRLGVTNPQVLTPRQADAIAGRAMKATKPEDSANLIAGLEAEYGEFFPKVFNQLVKDGKLAGEMLIIPNLPSQTAREAVSRLARVKESDLVQGIDAADQKAVKEAVTATLSEFSKTIPLMTQQAAGTVNAYETTLRKLTYQFMQGGTKAGEAAEQARTMLLGQYTFEGTTRFPKSVNASAMMTSADRMLQNDIGNIDVPRDLTGSRNGAELSAEWQRTVRARPQWFTRQDDGGIELWAVGNNGTRYRVTRGGQGVAYTWDELSASNAKAKADAVTNGSGGRARQRAYNEGARQRIEATRRQVEAEDGAR